MNENDTEQFLTNWEQNVFCRNDLQVIDDSEDVQRNSILNRLYKKYSNIERLSFTRITLSGVK